MTTFLWALSDLKLTKGQVMAILDTQLLLQ